MYNPQPGYIIIIYIVNTFKPKLFQAPQFYALNDDVALAAAEANDLRRSRDYEN